MLINKNTPKFSRRESESVSKQTTTLHNEPHVPMDAVMRGFEDVNWSRVGDFAKSLAGGAVLGAASGAFGKPGMIMTGTFAGAAAGAAPALANFALGAVGSEIEGREFDRSGQLDQNLKFDLEYGAVTGFVSGGLGLALAASTGMSPILAGAIAGAGTYLASDLAIGL